MSTSKYLVKSVCYADIARLPWETPQSKLAFILLNPQEDYRNYGFVSGTLYRRFIGANSKD
jgi:hypothetical protein